MVELLIFSLLLTNIVGLLCIRSVLKHSNLLAREHGRWDANTPKLSQHSRQQRQRYSSSSLASSNELYDIKSNGPVHSISFTVAGKKMSFETGKIGRQADCSVIAQTGDSMIYSTVCSEREPTPVDFTPLRVDYFARYSAVGQTVGAFHRRDGRGDDAEILVARLIDRPIRPMITEGWQHDTQILAWVLSYDKIHPCETLSVCAASAAMYLSQVPMIQPVAAVEVGMVDGELIVNPTKQQMQNSSLILTIAGTKFGILMVEGAADFLPEETMVKALQLGHSAIGEICDAIEAFQKVAGKPKRKNTLRSIPKDLVNSMDTLFGDRLTSALSISEKNIRGAAVAEVEGAITRRFVKEEAPSPNLISLSSNGKEINEKADSGAPLLDILDVDEDQGVYSAEASLQDDPLLPVDSLLLEDEASELSSSPSVATPSPPSPSKTAGYGYDPVDVKIAVKKLLVRRLREMILRTGKRSDGRTVEEVRPIFSESSLLPMAHGSALFTRGETQALATATLGSKSMEARFETLDELGSKRFYLQYRFPPSSVGEVGRVGGVNRREVGHGNLAERALLPSIPPGDVFPYSIRAESLITESCGSSSMATVCACCMAMLDAGVPLSTSIAGVAMGLILGEQLGDKPVILTDILGLEDALGTMDFKIAGNETGITTFQLDIKSEGLTLEVLQDALLQAKRGRLHILGEMKRCIDSPRKLKDSIPKITEFKILPDALGKVIGPKGKTVQTLIDTYGVKNINLEDDGSIQIESFSIEKNDLVKAAILKIVDEMQSPSKGGRGGGKEPKEEPTGPPPEVGIIYRDCPVKGIHGFGVFVEVLPGYEGLIHVSELDVKKVISVESAGFEIGQKLDVKYLGKNEKGQMRLSRRQVLMRDSSPTPTLASNGTIAVPNANITRSSNSSWASKPKQPAVATIAAIAEDAY